MALNSTMAPGIAAIKREPSDASITVKKETQDDTIEKGLEEDTGTFIYPPQ